MLYNTKSFINKYCIKSLLKRAYILLCIVTLNSCVGVKPAASKSGKNLYETFFVGKDGTQYFIKPLAFENEAGEIIKLDITLKHKKKIKGSAILNFSVINNEAFNEIDSLEIKNKKLTTSIKEVDFLFSEKLNKVFKSRFSGNLDIHDVKSLFENKDWELLVYKKTISISFYPTKKTNKNIDKLNSEIFSLF